MSNETKIVLAIDDNPAELNVIRSILKSQFDIRISKSAASALTLLEAVTVDIILLDIEMPGMSGFEFLHEVRKMPKYMNVPVIIISGHSGKEFVAHAKSVGAYALISKPINVADLLKKMQEAFDNPETTIFSGL